jgi:hypothetical protein
MSITLTSLQPDSEVGPHRRGVRPPRAPGEGSSGPFGSAIRRFEGVALEDLGDMASSDRIDTKFLVPLIQLPTILESCAPAYRMLEVEGRRPSRYRTLYFDTPALALYHAHHSGRLPRHKVRLRAYEDTGTRFLEIKQKTNKRRTLKSRFVLPKSVPDAAAVLAVDPGEALGQLLSWGHLRPVLTVEYTRLTLVAKCGMERVTLDLVPSFRTGGARRSLPAVAIVEVKREAHGRSRALEVVRGLRLREASLSKYCIGVATLHPAAKRNRFRETIRSIERMGGEAGALRPLEPMLMKWMPS